MMLFTNHNAAVIYYPRFNVYAPTNYSSIMPSYNLPIAPVAQPFDTVPDALNGYSEISIKVTPEGLRKRMYLLTENFGSYNHRLDFFTLAILFDRISNVQTVYLPLDYMYETTNVDLTSFNMPFAEYHALVQRVPRRESYDFDAVRVHKLKFNLQNSTDRYGVELQNSSLANSSVYQLRQSVQLGMYRRIKDARDGLENLKYHCDMYASGKARFSKQHPPRGTGRPISLPKKLNADNINSPHKMIDNIEDIRTAFFEEYDRNLNYFAMHPKTALLAACDAWSNTPFSHKISEYCIAEGVKEFPGIPGATAVISRAVSDKVIYAVAKHSYGMIKAEGPKIMTAGGNHNGMRESISRTDYYQYKCAHEDLGDSALRCGVIIDINHS